jgi:apolipoprotein N-acyltransferase
LLVWPEAALPVILEEEPLYFERVRDFVQSGRIPLLLGAVTSKNNLYYNSAILIYPDKALARYDKLHLVPFGEYIPLKNILPFLQTVVPIGDIETGKEYTLFKIPNQEGIARFATLICFEDLFPELSREFVQKGADFLINITNDAWYKKTSAAFQHLEASIFRAVENRIFLVRSANTGISGYISPKGKIISLVEDEKGSNIFVEGYQTKNVSLCARTLSFYTRHGPLFVFLCLILVLYGIITARKYRR